MIELALIGAGSMGASHGRVAMGLRDARLGFVVDPDANKGRALAEKVGAAYRPDLRSILDSIDAAIVAAPTAAHYSVAMELFSAGIHVLVEKPIAATQGEAQEMIEAANRAGLILSVGHIERFNPVVLELEHLVNSPIHVTAQRISPYTPRIRDGVTLDLMIHDLDLVASIARSPVTKVSAVTHDILADDDMTIAILEFENGMTASVTASRLGQDKVREITITQRHDFLRLDLIRQSVSIHRVGQIEESGSGIGYRQSGIVEVPFLQHRGEPLLLELGHFIDCVIGKAEPLVPGEDGLRAIQLVQSVKEAAIRHPAPVSISS